MSDIDAGLIEKYLEHVRVEKRLAQRTVELYSLDLQKLSDFAATANVELLRVQNAHIRRWVAQTHSRGRSGRGIALILSGWRGFYTWLGREGRVDSNPVQDVRAPKAPKPLPKALAVDDSVQLADWHDADADPWLEARDAAIVELLYGCGLRVGELQWALDAVVQHRRPRLDRLRRSGRGSRAGQSAASGAACRSGARRCRRWRPGWRCAMRRRSTPTRARCSPASMARD